MDVTTKAPQYASPVDYDRYGRYGGSRGVDHGHGWKRPRYRFQGRISADGSSGWHAEPGRYHLYIAWSCPWAQRTAIVRKLKGLEDIVSLSYVDDERDGRGWAFRERRGPDPVNGFTLLAQVYEATELGYDGHISVPVLWDRRAGRIVSNNFTDITLDLGEEFDAWGNVSIDLYPPMLRREIDALNVYLYETINDGPYRVAGAVSEQDYEGLRRTMIAGFDQLDARLAGSNYLFGDTITESDVRLWPTLARYDTFYNPMAGISERHLTDFPHLWRYARELYQQPAFRETTDFTSFSRPSRAPKPAFVNAAPWRLDVVPHPADWGRAA